jgi:hypothetical protein
MKVYVGFTASGSPIVFASPAIAVEQGWTTNSLSEREVVGLNNYGIWSPFPLPLYTDRHEVENDFAPFGSRIPDNLMQFHRAVQEETESTVKRVINPQDPDYRKPTIKGPLVDLDSDDDYVDPRIERD